MRCAYRYWCEGSKEKAVQLMVSLIKRFGLHDALRNELYASARHRPGWRLAIVLLRQGKAPRANLCACGFLYQPT